MKPAALSLRFGKNNRIFRLFLLFFLLAGCVLRSEMLLDQSFLPRFILLTTVLFLVFIFRIKWISSLRIGWYEIIFIVFYLWNIAGMLWSIVPSETLMHSQMVFLSIGLFLIVRKIAEEDLEFHKLFIGMVILLLVFSYILAFAKMFSLTFYDPYRIVSISANNNLFSGFLLLSFPVLISGYARLRSIWKYLCVACMILSAFFIVIVQSRAVYLGFSAGLFLFLFIMMMKFHHVWNKKNIITACLSLVLLATGILLFYRSLDETRREYFQSKIPVWNYFHTYQGLKAEREKAAADLKHMAQFDYAGDYYENANLRLIFWKKSLQLVTDHPVTGIGAGNWRLMVPSVPLPPNPDHTKKNYTYSYPHNEWIGFLSELGIPGLILAIVVFFAPVLLVFRKIFIKKEKTSVSFAGYAAFLTGFYVFAFFDFPFKRMEHLIILSCILGLMLAEMMRGKESSRIRGKYIIPFFIPLMALTLVIGYYRVKGEHYTRMMFLAEGKDQLSVILNADKAENLVYHITPNTLPVSWFKGVALYKLGDTIQARENFQQAVKYTPYEVRVINDYATALYNSGKVEEGKSYLLKCYQIDPYFEDAAKNLSVIYYLSGRYDSAAFYSEKK